jgi:hypothetical protein
MPERLTRSRAKGARLPEGAVCVDRSTVFGNPWQVGIPGRFNWPRGEKAGWASDYRLGKQPMTAPEAVRLFRDWLVDYQGYLGAVHHALPDSLTLRGAAELARDMAERRAVILRRLPALRGRDLACYCKPGCPCHADVLIELANA